MIRSHRHPADWLRSSALLFAAALLVGGCNTLLGIQAPRFKDGGGADTMGTGGEPAVPGDAQMDARGDVEDVGMPMPPDGPGGVGGLVGTGGSVGLGGAVGTGGSATGGAPGSAGGIGTGGNATGGMSGSTGGTTATGGTQGSTGGMIGTGGKMPPPPPPIAITTVSLPDAIYNVAYDVQLAASGGAGGNFHWRLSSGSLPQGLDLTPNGNLRGTPVQEGGFSFTVGVFDDSEADETTAMLVLKVLRKRWLVYRASASGDAPNNYGLYVIDVKTPAFKTPISTNIPPLTGSVTDQFQFSPDGRYLAYLAYAVLAPQLYVVDMSGDRPGEPRRVNDNGVVRSFAWSPDATSLAFSVDTDQQTDFIVADVRHPEAPQQHLTGMLGDAYNVSFLTDDLVTFSFSEGQLMYARRAPGGGPFGQPQFMNLFGVMWARWPELETAAFAEYGDGCPGYSSWHLIDFRALQDNGPLNGFLSVSPAADYLAHHQQSDLTYRIYRMGLTDPIATFTTPSRYCSPGSWSHVGRQFATANDAGVLQVIRVDGTTATTTTVPGSYGVVNTTSPPLFSPNDRWLGFSTDHGAYVVRNGQPWEQPVGRGRALNPPPPLGGMVIGFSPDSRFLASIEIAASGRPVYATVIDTAKNPPTWTERGLSDDGGIFQLGWSVHSTEIALIVRERAGTNLYLFNPALTPIGSFDGNVTGFFCGEGNTGCQQVTQVQFQP